MSDTTNKKLVDINFTLNWESSFAKHTEVYHLYNVDPYNDDFPLEFGTQVASLKVGESCTETFHSKEVIGEEFDAEKVMSFDSKLFNKSFKGGLSTPILYRYYPKAIAWQGFNTSERDYSPFRLISINEDKISVDHNHPLAKYYLTLTATIIKEHKYPKKAKAIKDIGKLITSKGPGMQTPFQFGDSVFFDQYPFDIKEGEYSAKPRLDAHAINQIKAFYSEQLSKNSKVLDLMSDQSSYFADDFQTGLVVGIGENEKELASNEKLDTYNVQNINEDVILPYEAHYFDDAICTLSIEYLIDPLEMMYEIYRVVKPGGKFIIVFSDNPAAPKSISLWEQLHSFEKIQLGIDYFLNSEIFHELGTFSNRGERRSKDDPDYLEKPFSDSVYAVWGRIKSNN